MHTRLSPPSTVGLHAFKALLTFLPLSNIMMDFMYFPNPYLDHLLICLYVRIWFLVDKTKSVLAQFTHVLIKSHQEE